MISVAIIPARGGSKRIPKKNLAIFGGVPLIVHTIRHALDTPEVDFTVVSTDCPDIARVAEGCGAKVIWRPAEFSGDKASSESACQHALTSFGQHPDLVAFLQATSPLRRPKELSLAIQKFRDEGADSLFSGCRIPGFVWRKEPYGWDSLNYDFRKRPRHQDIPYDLMENGSFYLFKPWVLEDTNNRLGGKIIAHEMPFSYSLEIDVPEDLTEMERLYSAMGYEDAIA